jgi:hypothetical protein
VVKPLTIAICGSAIHCSPTFPPKACCRRLAAERAALIGAQASLQHRYGNPYAHQQGAKLTKFVPYRRSVPAVPSLI